MSLRIDDRCLKPIMVSKPYILSDDNTFLRKYSGLMRLYNALFNLIDIKGLNLGDAFLSP